MENSKVKKDRLTLALVFESLMALFYLGFAVAMLLTPVFDNIVGAEYRLPLGFLLAAYGIFRIYRAVRKLMQAKKSEEE